MPRVGLAWGGFYKGTVISTSRTRLRQVSSPLRSEERALCKNKTPERYTEAIIPSQDAPHRPSLHFPAQDAASQHEASLAVTDCMQLTTSIRGAGEKGRGIREGGGAQRRCGEGRGSFSGIIDSPETTECISLPLCFVALLRRSTLFQKWPLVASLPPPPPYLVQNPLPAVPCCNLGG